MTAILRGTLAGAAIVAAFAGLLVPMEWISEQAGREWAFAYGVVYGCSLVRSLGWLDF